MEQVKQVQVTCPSCGQPTYITVEPADIGEDFIEDCANCCSPIHIQVTALDDGEWSVQVDGDDEQLY